MHTHPFTASAFQIMICLRPVSKRPNTECVLSGISASVIRWKHISTTKKKQTKRPMVSPNYEIKLALSDEKSNYEMRKWKLWDRNWKLCDTKSSLWDKKSKLWDEKSKLWDEKLKLWDREVELIRSKVKIIRLKSLKWEIQSHNKDKKSKHEMKNWNYKR